MMVSVRIRTYLGDVWEFRPLFVRAELLDHGSDNGNDLRGSLASAIGVSATSVESLLWEAPRSLLLAAVPTLVRRLFRRWRLAFPGLGGKVTRQYAAVCLVRRSCAVVVVPSIGASVRVPLVQLMQRRWDGD
jgi:hypothetical protein